MQSDATRDSTISWRSLSELTDNVELEQTFSTSRQPNKGKLPFMEGDVLNIKPLVGLAANFFGISTDVQEDADPNDPVNGLKASFHIWNPQV